MENLLDKIISHIIMKLKSGDTDITKQKIAMDLNITENVFDIVCMKTKIPGILSDLSGHTDPDKLIKKLTHNPPCLRSIKSGNDLHVTREKICQIETKAFNKLNKAGHDKEPPDDAA